VVVRLICAAVNGDIVVLVLRTVALDVEAVLAQEVILPLLLLPLLLLLQVADLLLPPGTVLCLIHLKDHAFQDLVVPLVLQLVVMESLR